MAKMLDFRLMVAPLFVVMWSTGFIGAKLGTPYAEPLTFLSIRFACVAAILGAWLIMVRARWPSWSGVGYAALIGLLVHGVYLGGTFVAISWGTEAGVSALIAGLQPITTALLARQVFGDRLSRLQQVGMILGASGVGLVVIRKLEAGVGDFTGVVACLVGLAAITAGAVLQKTRAGETPMLTGNFVQFAAAGVVMSLLAFALETRTVTWTGEFLFALGWLVVVLSIGAVTLYYLLIDRGGASSVASLFFLVPPSTAIIAYVLFNERFGQIEVGGIVLAALGVLMVNRPEVVRGLLRRFSGRRRFRG